MQIEVIPEPQWGGEIAERWCDRLQARPNLVMCLPTGATPRPVYEVMADAVDIGAVSFADATVFLLDEFGGLDGDDPARCSAMIQRDLLDHVDLRPDHLHRLDPEAEDLDLHLKAYRSAVLEARLDLTLVGLGRNGHVGLNEPGSQIDSVTRRVDLDPETQESMRAYGGDRSADWGVTLGLSEILSSSEVWLLVTGDAKAEIARKVLEKPISPKRPASLLRRHHHYRAFLDEPAARQLDRG